MTSGGTYLVFAECECDIDNITEAIFAFKGKAEVKKSYPTEVTYSDGKFAIPLTQENTIALVGDTKGYMIELEGEIIYASKAVSYTDRLSFFIPRALVTPKVISGNTPSSTTLANLRFEFKDNAIIANVIVPEEQIQEVVEEYVEEHHDEFKGDDGKSAYEVAVDEGYTGTEEEWLASLHGADGEDGYTPRKGVDYFTASEISDIEDYVIDEVSDDFVAKEVGKGLSTNDYTNADKQKVQGALQSSEKGEANGVAELDENGIILSTQLPSYVDDVLEYTSESQFPNPGESGKIYIATDTNLSYRWGGTGYVKIVSDLALGETAQTAYRGDRGKTAYDHSQLTSGNPHNVTKANVGLGNVDNTSDLQKPISTATQTALNAKANASDLTAIRTTLGKKIESTPTMDFGEVTNPTWTNNIVTMQGQVSQLSEDLVKLENHYIALNSNDYIAYIEKENSEYFSGPKKYGFWIPIKDYKDYDKLYFYCKNVDNGNVNVYYANSNKELINTIQLTFSDNLCEFVWNNNWKLDANFVYLRIIGNNSATSNSIMYIGLEEHGMSWVNDKTTYMYSKFDDMYETVNDINDTYYGDEISIDSEYMTGPASYGFYLPIDNQYVGVGISTTVYVNEWKNMTVGVAPYKNGSMQNYPTQNTFNSEGYCTLEVSGDNVETTDYRLVIPNSSLITSYSKLKVDTSKYGVYERFLKTESIVSNAQIDKVCDDSTIKCIPYMFKQVNWNSYTPRLNVLCFPDFNEEVKLLSDTSRWFNDALIDKGIDAIICQGDTVSSVRNTIVDWKAKASNVVSVVNKINKPFIFCVGNHDTGEDNYVSSPSVITRSVRYENWYFPLLNRLKTVVGNDNVHTDSVENSMYYYVDLNTDGRKVRFFAMDESEYPIVVENDGTLRYSMCVTKWNNGSPECGFNTYYSYSQLNFLKNAMISCPNDTLFVLLNHINYDKVEKESKYYGSLSGCKEALYNIIKAWRTNTSTIANVDAIENVSAYSITADFTSCSGNHPFIFMKAHEHYFNCNKIDNDFYEVMTTCGGTPSTQIKCKDSVSQYGVDILSVNNDFSAYFLRFGYAPNLRYSGQDKDGFHYVDSPISLV